MRKVATLLVAAALVATACSSSRPQSQPGSIPSIATSPSEPGGAPTTAPSETGSPGPRIVAGTAVGPTPSAPTRNGSSRGPKVSARYGPTAQGVTATRVKIGFWWISTGPGCQVTGTQEGGTGCDDTDTRQIDSIVKYVNAHGGVAGRKIDAKIYKTKISEGQYAAQAQATCEHLTNDDHVFAAVSEGQIGRSFMTSCLAQHHTIVIEPGTWPFDRTLRSQLVPYLYQPSRAAPERWVRAYVDGLAAQGFFKKGAKYGLVRYASAPFDRVTENVFVPRLAKYGVTLTETAEITPPPGLSGYGDLNQQISSAILRFSSRNVDHVMFFTTMGELSVFWYNQADAANFTPRYGLSTMDYPRKLAGTTPDQFENAIGVGWTPQFDVAPENDPGGNPTTKVCAKIMTSVGVDPDAGRRTHCDGVFFLKAVLDRAPALNAAGFRAAVESLGSSFVPANAVATYFGPGRYDGPSRLRYLKYDSACECFKYYGGVHVMP